jgi:hypothetical protein
MVASHHTSVCPYLLSGQWQELTREGRHVSAVETFACEAQEYGCRTTREKRVTSREQAKALGNVFCLVLSMLGIDRDAVVAEEMSRWRQMSEVEGREMLVGPMLYGGSIA